MLNTDLPNNLKPQKINKVANANNTDADIETYSLTIMTERNQPLAATVYRPSHTVTTAVMIAPATGIKRQFYHNFASYLAEHGFGVISFDNEGISESLTTTLAKCDASLISWGRHDMPAVLDALQLEFAEANYHLIGHSAGGQLLGLMPNYQALSAVFNVACSSGCIANMDMPYKLKAIAFMDAFIPVSNLVLGYTPADKIAMGEPLPRGVARQWREWCNGSGYINTALDKTIHTHFYNEITTPALWLGFSDDEIANSVNIDDMIRVFPKMLVEKHYLDPKDLGVDNIGHMRYFSRKTHAQAPQLWQMAVDWLNKKR